MKNEVSMKFFEKESTKAVFKLAISLSIAGVVISAVVAAGFAINDYREKLDRKPYAEPVRRSINAGSLGFTVSITTKHSDYSMAYIIKGEGYPNYFSDPQLRFANLDRGLSFVAKGADGFRITEFKVLLKDIQQLIGSDGKPTGFQYEGTQMVSLEDYKRIERFELGWDLKTELRMVCITPAKARVDA
jgi:hypothetical protein